MPDVQGDTKTPEVLPFALLKVTVRGKIIPQFGYKIVPLQHCQKASHLFLQIAAELEGGFSHGQPYKHEYQIRLVLPASLGLMSRKHHVVSNDDDLQGLLLPFAKREAVLEPWNTPLILVDFVSIERSKLARKRSSEPGARKFHRMVDMVRANPESLYAGPNLILSLLNAVHDLEQSNERASGSQAEDCLETREQEDPTNDDETKPSRTRQKLTNFVTVNDRTHTPEHLAADQAAEHEKISSLLEDKARLSEKVFKLADELERTRVTIHALTSQKLIDDATEKYRAYQSQQFTKKAEEDEASLNAIRTGKKLIAAKSKCLVKNCQKQWNTLKRAKTSIDWLEDEMERMEAKKNTRIDELEVELGKALVYIDGLHKHYGISTAASKMLARQFCDDLRRQVEINAAAQPDAAEEDQKNLKRKRSESET